MCYPYVCESAVFSCGCFIGQLGAQSWQVVDLVSGFQDIEAKKGLAPLLLPQTERNEIRERGSGYSSFR